MNLTQEQKYYLWHKGPWIEEYGEGICIDNFFNMVKANQYKIQYRVMLARYRGKPICPTCHGTRLKKEATYVKVGGASITELVEMVIEKTVENGTLSARISALEAEREMKLCERRACPKRQPQSGY